MKNNQSWASRFSGFFSCLSIFSLFFLFLPVSAYSIVITYNDNWGEQGFNLIESDAGAVEIVFSVTNFLMEEETFGGELYRTLSVPGILLPNDAGAPNLPGTGRFIAMPTGATAILEIVDFRSQTMQGIKIGPAPVIPKENDDSPLKYEKNPDIYNTNAFYPPAPASISERTEIRGVEAVVLGISPFQYNPVTEELVIYKDLRVRITFQGGNGHFGEDRLRSRYWEPVLKENLLNYTSLPEIDFNSRRYGTDETGFEYLIVIPNDSTFLAWADTLKNWRQLQGISTGIVTLAEIGGNNSTLIDNYIINAYYTWDIPPAAVLLLSDYESTGDNYGITSPYWNGYCVSDNMYADVGNDNLPDVALARITAQNGTHLQRMISKMLDFERTPPTDPNYYETPLIAGGWQTDRWFILCTEVVLGYHYWIQEKTPHREYALYSGTPGTVWSTAQNTTTVVNYFGPGGLNYIRSTPSYLTNWTGGAAGINSTINNGTFMVLHRDHGYESGWGEPAYSTANVNQLTNQQPTFVFSINCLTGKYNWGSNCFTEAFHRNAQGAYGLIAASEVSYSFVNDAYVWGMWDSMWPDFDPGYGMDEIGLNTLRPCFANVSGKYYLQASSWPYNTNNKVHTYHLFHHHGDAFITMYSEVPEDLTVTFPPVIFDTDSTIEVLTADGAVVALTVDGEILDADQSHGAEMEMVFAPQLPGTIITLTATLQNHYRYTGQIQVIANQPQYVLFDTLTIDDAAGGNGNGQADLGETLVLSITVKNVGTQNAENVDVTIASEDPYVDIVDAEEYYGTVAAGGTLASNGGFTVEIAFDVPDSYDIPFTLTAANGMYTWQSAFTITAFAPSVIIETLTIDDAAGNNNGLLDPGETVDFELRMTNAGSVAASDITAVLSTTEMLISIPQNTLTIASLPVGSDTVLIYSNISANQAMAQGTEIPFELSIAGWGGYIHTEEFSIIAGNDLYNPSGPDGYGYYAYDSNDGILAPDYEWLEIAPSAGGSGTALALGNDQTTQVDLPFTFTYYGLDYNQVNVCSNGWISFGITNSFIPVNLQMPNTLDPNGLTAPFWDDLNTSTGGQVSYLYNAAEHQFIIEYYIMAHVSNPAERETFQVVLCDPAYYSTPTGDGEIIVHYNYVSGEDDYCTVGIENETGTVGLQYVWNNSYTQYACPLQSGFSIKFTTNFYIDPNVPSAFNLISPAAGDTVNALPGALLWNRSIDPNPGWTPGYDVWLDSNPQMSSKWCAVYNHPDTTYLCENLEDDQTYYWTARATDINSAGTWASDTLSFATYFPEAPLAFGLMEPADGASLLAWPTLFRWSESVDPDPGDVVTYIIWFVCNGDSIGYTTLLDSVVIFPDTISVLSPEAEAEWYVTASSNYPVIAIECEQRFSFTPTTLVDGDFTSIPMEFKLHQNYPNPFNNQTSVKFDIAEAGMVTIAIYDILGRQAAMLTQSHYSPGYYDLKWDASVLSSGIYFIKMETPGYSRTIKTLLLK